jgi:hypothetical protein
VGASVAICPTIASSRRARLAKENKAKENKGSEAKENKANKGSGLEISVLMQKNKLTV